MMRGYSPVQISQIRAILVSIAIGRISVPNGGSVSVLLDPFHHTA
jgi:hypothetical protein